ncbi:transmembrane protein 179B-like isoform X1 [Polyodon spathula]|uniref:transmembrane protein 179B-like isoform X1 n=1 Tax=Polyodon spathula TaxID=7913 RepID=UPI001B7DCAEA|nr:transmembrane protein 179B-like isoform X1 [Polyodon spathula]
MAQWLLVAELTCVRCVFFICGIITVSSLTITQGEFAGRCMLYGTVHYNASSSEFCVESSSNASLCYFVSAISILIAIYCFSVVLYWVYARCVDEVQRGSVWMTLSLCIAVTFLFFLLVSGCILNIGLNGLCQSITAAKDLKSCQAAQLEKWSAPNKSSLFYTSLHNAQVSAWVNFFFWVVALILLIVQRKRGTWFTQLSGTGDPETDPIFHRPHCLLSFRTCLSRASKAIFVSSSPVTALFISAMSSSACTYLSRSSRLSRRSSAIASRVSSFCCRQRFLSVSASDNSVSTLRTTDSTWSLDIATPWGAINKINWGGGGWVLQWLKKRGSRPQEVQNPFCAGPRASHFTS